MEVSTNYRLCVFWLCAFASGSLITEIFSCWTFTNVSCLHFGQYNGKLVSVVSRRNLVRVLFLHKGHRNHSSLFTASPPLSQSNCHLSFDSALSADTSSSNQSSSSPLSISFSTGRTASDSFCMGCFLCNISPAAASNSAKAAY